MTTQGAILQRGLIDDPTGVNFYAYPSLAVNQFNDVLIGYSRFASNQYASANFAFRAGNDPPNTMRQDTVLKPGEGPFTRTILNQPPIRWGDYSAAVVDPANDTDLWTIQEYAAAPAAGKTRWGTWWGHIVPPPLTLSISDATITEGDAGTTNAVFTVHLSKTNDQIISVDFATADGSALAGLDYIATNGTLTFNPGETLQTISVPVLGDLLDETNETFFVNLSNPTNIVLAYTQAIGTILDDDPLLLSLSDVAVSEGNTGTTEAHFILSLSKPFHLAASVDFTTVDGSALADSDYIARSGTLVFNPGQTSNTLTILVKGDVMDETNETFFVRLSNPTNAVLVRTQAVATIVDDDPQPSLSINDVSVVEGDVGTTDAVFTVSLSTPSGLLVRAQIGTANGTATAGADYFQTNRVLNFPPGTTNQKFTVRIIGDTIFETNETFLVRITGINNATIARSPGVGTILDDDFKVTTVQLAGSDARLSFTTQTNQTYRVERTDELRATAVWTTVPGASSVPGTGTIVQVLDGGGAYQPQRFYRTRIN